MPQPPTRLSSFAPREPLWARYTFAVAASVLAWVLDVWLSSLVATPVSPFLPGFAAIIASAAWAGFGPGLLSTGIVTFWCALMLYNQNLHSVSSEIVRCAIFVAEGVMLSIGSDRLRRATREVARSEDWHRRLVDTSGEGIWVTDADIRITWANPRIAEILGAVEAGEIEGRPVGDFIFPEDISIERIRLQNRRAGVKEQFDRRLRRKDGSEAWVLACSNPILDRNGEFLGVLAMMTDITERKRAEHALRRSEERFRSLFDNVLEGVYQSTPGGRILAANPMLFRMLDLASEAELNDVDIAKDLYVDPNVRKRLLERLEREGSFQNVEYQLRRRNGQIITVQENARVVRDEEGKVLYYEGTLTDITERLRLDERLRQAEKMEALGRLAGGIAHDFSNVLTIISGYAQLAVTELPLTHPARLSAEHVVRAADSATGMTRQLLTFSRRQASPQVPVDVNRVIRKALGGNAEFVLSVPREAAPVDADEGHIEQIVLNLVGTARKALGSDVTLEVRTETVEVAAAFCRHYPGTRPGSYTAASVREAGSNEATSSDTRGSKDASTSGTPGFGVGAAHTIVSQYGGFMVVDSLPGRGSVFSVYLPRAESLDAIRPADSRRLSGPAPVRQTILLVDDEPLTRELSRDMLERQGYRVLLASDAREAESIGRRGDRFDLLITDLVMPQTGGIDLARTLRAAIPGLKVLFISGYSGPDEVHPTASPGDEFLQKPFSVDSLGRKIRQILDRPC